MTYPCNRSRQNGIMDHNRDYILRIVQLLIDALLSISRSVDKEDFIGAKKQIDYSFKILRKPEVFFC